MDNVIEIRFNGKTVVESDVNLTQYDRGQRLKFVDIDLPSNYIVHFSNEDRRGFARPSLGNKDGVVVPIKYLSQGNNVYAWVYLIDGESGKSEYKVIVPIQPRSMPVYDDPTPVEESFIEQVLAEVNSEIEGVRETSELSREYAEASRESAKDSEDSANRSKYYSELSESAASKNGYFYFTIDERGHLIEVRTDNVSEDLEFSLRDGRMIITYV